MRAYIIALALTWPALCIAAYAYVLERRRRVTAEAELVIERGRLVAAEAALTAQRAEQPLKPQRPKRTTARRAQA